MANKVPIKSVKELNAMHTGSLMKRREALLKCDESLLLSDIEETQYSVDNKFIEFKNTSQWKQSYTELKNILSTRENIPSKKERKILRQERAKKRR